MRLRFVLALALAATPLACKKHASSPTAIAPPVRTGDDAEKLWALAPPNVSAGEIITPGGMTVLGHGFERVRKLIDTTPELAPMRETFDRGITRLFGSPEGKLADAGLAADRGFAGFMVGDDGIAILPVVDRAKFVAALHGTHAGDVDTLDGFTCKQVDAGYACATSDALFAQLGKGTMKGQLAAAGARGDVEIYLGPQLLGGGLTAGYIAIALDDGLLDAHGFLAGKVPPLQSLVGAHALAPEPHASGFILANLQPLLAAQAEHMGDEPTAPLLKAIKGPIAATMSASELAFQARVPLTDTKPWETLLASCDKLTDLVGLPAKTVDGVCSASLPGTIVPVSFQMWIEDGELRVGNKKGALALGAGSPTAIGQELASGEYPFALWGRGTVFAADLSAMFGKALGANTPEVPLMLRVFSQLDEIGLGAKVAADGIHVRAYGRTIWANPTDVAEQLAAISSADLISGKGAKTAADLAAAHPDSPFAGDYAAGQSGMMMPIATVGMLAAVAVPAFVEYMKRSKESQLPPASAWGAP